MLETTLIGIVGTTPVQGNYCYFMEDDNCIASPLSVLALQRHLKPDRVIVLGTSKALEEQQQHLDGVETVAIPDGTSEDEFKEIFKAVLANIQHRNVVLDLTQGFRHQQILLFLGGFIRGVTGVSLKLYYSMDISQNQDQLIQLGVTPVEKQKYFKCTTLHNFLEIGNLALILSLFTNSFNISNIISVTTPELVEVIKGLQELSQDLLENNIHSAIDEAEQVLQKIKGFLESDLGSHVKESAHGCLELLERLSRLKKQSESEKLLYFCEIMLERKYLLNAATFLYEGMMAYIQEKTLPKIKPLIKTGQNPTSYQKNQLIKELMHKHTIRDNYLKKLFHDTRTDILGPYRNMESLLNKVNTIRNNAAHAFTNKRSKINYEKDLKQYYEAFAILRNNPLILTDKKKLDKLFAW